MLFQNLVISDLVSLSVNDLYSIPKIEWWLLKYFDKYETIKELEFNKYWYKIDGKNVRLPPLNKPPTEEEKFVKIYDELNTISFFHRNEISLKQEIAIYKSLKNKPEEVIKWLTRNEELYLDKYYEFSVNYFGDVDEMKNDIHLKLFFLEDLERVVYVNRNDFMNTIEFTSIFNNTYWELLEKLEIQKLN